MKRFLIVLTVFLLAAGHVFGQLGIQDVARVSLHQRQNITVDEFKEYVKILMFNAVGNPNARLPEADRRQALITLGNMYMISQAAEQEKLITTKETQEFNQAFDQQIKEFSAGMAQSQGRPPPATTAEIDAELQRGFGMSRTSFKNIFWRQYVCQKYMQRYIQTKKLSLFEAIKQPTEAEILAIYNREKSKSTIEGGLSRPDTVKVRMLVAPVQNPAGKAAAQATINRLSQQIGNNPGKFDEAARDSIKPNSGYVAIDGFVYKHERIRQAMGSAFVDAIFRLNQGQVSSVLERSDGFFVIKVLESYSAKVLALDDIYSLEDTGSIDQQGRRIPPSTVRQIIAAAEVQQRFLAAQEQATNELIEELRKKNGNVQIVDDIFNQIVW